MIGGIEVCRLFLPVFMASSSSASRYEICFPKIAEPPSISPLSSGALPRLFSNYHTSKSTPSFVFIRDVGIEACRLSQSEPVVEESPS